MNISIEGVIYTCDNILNGLGNLDSLEDYDYNDICDTIEDLNNFKSKVMA